MKCPHCSLVDLPEGGGVCVVCGYEPPTTGSETTAPQQPVPTELDARRELGREFRIEALLQAGPPTIVYLAYDPRQDRQVEVKVTPRGPLREAGVEDRFRRAAEAVAALDHPHIIPIYRCGITTSFLWYSTKHVDGHTVAETIAAHGPMALADCQRVLEQVASALDYAHRRGVSHGALSPANVVIDMHQWALVGDFAVAEVVATGRSAAELFNARGPTPSVDQYALAALACECLSGTPPADGTAARLSELRPEIPAHVAGALGRALNKRPTERFPSVLDFVAAVGGSGAGATAGSAQQRGPMLSSLNPRRGPGSPVLIMDYEPEPRRVGRRFVAAAGLVLALGAAGIWLTLSSLPAAPAKGNRLGRPRTPPSAPAPLPNPPPPPPPSVAQADPPPSQPADSRPIAPSPTGAHSDARSETAPQRTERPPAPRPAAPRVTHTTPPATRRPPPPPPPPPPAPVERRMEPARLSVNSMPWGNVYVDGQLIGNTPIGSTPQTEFPIWPGTHSLRVEREGFQPYERTFEAAPGQRLKITDIVLRELAP